MKLKSWPNHKHVQYERLLTYMCGKQHTRVQYERLLTYICGKQHTRVCLTTNLGEFLNTFQRHRVQQIAFQVDVPATVGCEEVQTDALSHVTSENVQKKLIAALSHVIIENVQKKTSCCLKATMFCAVNKKQRIILTTRQHDSLDYFKRLESSFFYLSDSVVPDVEPSEFFESLSKKTRVQLF